MIYYIILLVGMLQSQNQYEHFDLTWNINIAQSILANPDTIKVTLHDTTVWNSERSYSKHELYYNKIIKYIKDNFSDKNNILVSEMTIGPRLDEEKNLLGYAFEISFKDKNNFKTIDFLFFEKEKGKWRIYAIKTDDDKDPFR